MDRLPVPDWSLLAVLVVLGLLWFLYRTRARLADTQYQLDRSHRAREQLAATLEVEREARQAIGLTATCGLLLTDRERRITWLNEQTQGMLDYAEPLGRPLIEVLPSYEINQTVQDAVERNALVERQVTYKQRLWRVRARPAGPDGTILALEDVTELQRLGRARRDFVANISHDLRTPITTIQLTVETLRNGALSDPGMTSRMLENIAVQADALQQLASELFDLSQIESGQVLMRLVPVSGSQICGPVVERLQPQAERKTLSVHVDLAQDMLILADLEQVQKVVANLLHNAIKFTAPAKRVGIESSGLACQDGVVQWQQISDAAAGRAPAFPPGGLADGEWALFRVWDEGPGIPAADQSRIFERFYKGDRARLRTGETGAGLGLAIARHIILGHGGQIWVASSLGRGASFYFTLPLA